MKHIYYFILVSILLMLSCKNESKNNDYSDENIEAIESNSDDGYKNGDYCAEVDYYYDKTGTNSSYTLKVEINNNQLIKIYWPNGGWLDNSHFTPPSISDGQASFISDQGVEYNVRIIGTDGDCYYSNNALNEDDLIEDGETKKVDGIIGTVIWDSYSCDYVVIYTENNWYVVAEKYSGAYNLSQGDKVRGDIVGFGFEEVYCINKDKEMRLYIDNYYTFQSSAEELIFEKCN